MGTSNDILFICWVSLLNSAPADAPNERTIVAGTIAQLSTAFLASSTASQISTKTVFIKFLSSINIFSLCSLCALCDLCGKKTFSQLHPLNPVFLKLFIKIQKQSKRKTAKLHIR